MTYEAARRESVYDSRKVGSFQVCKRNDADVPRIRVTCSYVVASRVVASVNNVTKVNETFKTWSFTAIAFVNFYLENRTFCS